MAGRRKPTTTEESIGQRLKRLRLDAGLSQRDLQTSGVSYAYISRIEAGTRNPSVKALRQLAERLDIPPAYLEFGDGGIRNDPTFKALSRKLEATEKERDKLIRQVTRYKKLLQLEEEDAAR